MVTAHDCLKKYGPAHLEKAMVLWDVPAELEIGVIPRRIYCNRDMVQPLERELCSKVVDEQLMEAAYS